MWCRNFLPPAPHFHLWTASGTTYSVISSPLCALSSPSTHRWRWRRLVPRLSLSQLGTCSSTRIRIQCCKVTENSASDLEIGWKINAAAGQEPNNLYSFLTFQNKYTMHCTENPIYVFPRNETAGPRSQFLNAYLAAAKWVARSW